MINTDSVWQGKHIISFSLWGNEPKYTEGAIKNAALAARWYPGWICRFHVGRSVSSACVDRLRSFGNSEVVLMPSRGSWEDLVWRFHPASDDDVEVLLSRDTDGRLGQREKAAVERWLTGDRDFHIMRDHPEHHAPILGGMWGVRTGMLSAMKEDLREYKPGNYWQADHDFLRAVVYPKVKDHCLVHDEFYGGEPFPTPREDSEFVGQPFDENDRPIVAPHSLKGHLGRLPYQLFYRCRFRLKEYLRRDRRSGKDANRS